MDKINIARDYIRAVARGYSSNLLLVGKQGTGKTHITLEILREEKVKHVVITSAVSALTLYKTLYNHNAKDTVIVFDDIEGIFEDDKAYSLMLSAMGDKRIMWLSTTSLLETVPSTFTFEGRIIVLANFINIGKKIRQEAIKSRCLHYELDLTNKEILTWMKELAETRTDNLSVRERLEILAFIEQQVDKSTVQLSLRTQQRCEELYQYNKEKWKELSVPFLAKDDSLFVLVKCLNEAENIDKAQLAFTKATGFSRRSFYRLKKEMER